MTGPPDSSAFSLPNTGRAAITAGVWAAGNDGGEDVDRPVPDTNDKADETVVDRCDLEAFSREAFDSEPCLSVPVSFASWG